MSEALDDYVEIPEPDIPKFELYIVGELANSFSFSS